MCCRESFMMQKPAFFNQHLKQPWQETYWLFAYRTTESSLVFFRCIGYRITKIMNDYLHRLVSPLEVKNIENVFIVSAARIQFNITFHFNNIIGDIK